MEGRQEGHKITKRKNNSQKEKKGENLGGKIK
jgi:hypothetical protein